MSKKSWRKCLSCVRKLRVKTYKELMCIKCKGKRVT